MASRTAGVTLTDASALVALLDPGELHHTRCVETAKRLQGLLLTSWPAFTEAMSLLGRNMGWRGQEALWRLVQDGVLAVAEQAASVRIANLMQRYRNVPMDLADASLIDLADGRGVPVIFSLDHDFRVYRTRRGGVLQMLP